MASEQVDTLEELLKEVDDTDGQAAVAVLLMVRLIRRRPDLVPAVVSAIKTLVP